MSLRRKILTNAGSNWIGTFVAISVGIIIVPMILGSVKKEGYGVWALLAGGLSYVAILDRALLLAVNRFVAFADEDISKRNGYISASFLVLSGFACFTVMLFTTLSFFVADIFQSIPRQLSKEAQYTCILVGFTFACKMIQANFTGALMGRQAYVLSNSVLVFGNLSRLVFTFCFLLVWKSIVMVQLAFLCTAITTMISMYIVAKIKIEGLKLGRSFVSKKIFKELFHYTTHSITRSGSMAVMLNTMTLLVGYFGTAADVTVYDIAMRIPQAVRGTIAGTQNVFLPTITSFFARQEIQRIKTAITRGTWMSSILTGFALVLLFFYVEDVLNLWLRGNVPAVTPLVMKVVILSVIPSGLFDIWLPSLVAMGYLKGLTVSSIVMAISAIISVIFLIFTGVVEIPFAPAISLVIVFAARSGVWLPIYGLHKLNFNYFSYIYNALFRPACGALIFGITIWSLKPILSKMGIGTIYSLGISGITGVVIYITIVLGKETKDLMLIIKNRCVK